ncbi:MAG TPA: winged helix-turn-helix transcriptional regulator [Candidatus Pacearchaeota archaeon]|nr:divergent AAA domain protein [archaeon BMS3Abin17]HDK42837.1 winged helix-turn-helix transcriptional regulator [Candidatus Pacearchaeota archaeon]HDZ60744.1 winged helix-turn-helix transcriptional regulator [Candidatus Pacearchaeota archaeon]
MNKGELIKKLQDIEWEDFEVKEAKSEIPKNSWESISAFANTNGGWLIFGVRKEGKKYSIRGVKTPEKIEQDFTTVLRNKSKFNSVIKVKSKKYKFEDKTILAFYIPLSENKPVFYNNPKNTFIRSGSGDQRATQEEVNSMFRDSAFGTKDKETTEFKLKDLDNETLERFRNYLRNLDPSNPYNELSQEKIFEKLRVTINKEVSIAGLLMFGTEDSISKIFPNFMIDYLEIHGTSYADAPERYTYRMPLQKNLFNYFFSLSERLHTKIDIPFKLKGFFRDENQPQVLAIREAIVNLLAHSDYFSTMKPRIRVFLDRIEFMNPGSLPVPVEVLRKQELTFPRNPILIKLFRVLKLAENAGYGFDKMFNGWKSYYKTEPIVEDGTTFYKISFPLKVKFDGNASEKYPEKYSEKYPETNKTQLRIIYLMSRNPKITGEELANELRLSLEGIKKNIKQLKQKSIIKRIGPDKGGSWIVKN